MPLTIELPDDILSLLEAEARAEGRTPGELAADRVRQSFATAPRNGKGAEAVPTRRYPTFVAPRTGKTAEQITQELREKHGFPPEWGTGAPRPFTAEEQAELDKVFYEMYPDFDFEAYNAKYPDESHAATNRDATTDSIK